MSCTLSAFRVTAPEVTVKSVELNEATPLLDEVASSAEIVKVSVADTTASIPSPEVIVNVLPKSKSCVFEPSEIVILLFVNELFPIFVKVFEAPLIVLLVNVSVVSLNTIVPEAFGKLIVLSAVGSTVVKVVSYASALAPSNTNAF
jgi:hypothetical protein